MDRVTLTQLSVLFFLLYNTGWYHIAVEASRVTLTNNGYKNLVVAISSETPVNQSDIIISNIKKMVLEASPVLYKATENRAFFESVHILIPESWSNIEANFSTWETFDTADVIVDALDFTQYDDGPYTQHNGKCGEMGERIHMSPNYLMTLFEEQKVLQYGKPGKVFVHEWAHYRYGVFDEYGTAKSSKYPLFYRKSGSNFIEPNVCSDLPINLGDFSVWDMTDNATTCRIDPVTNNYNENCRFKFNSKIFKPSTSLASYHLLDSVVHFCKDGQHNTEAQNKHNDMCERKSTWTVIMESSDFKGNNVLPVDLHKLPTEFHIVKSAGSRFVVVMDVSGSMKEFDRIGKLGESVRSWIKNDLPNGSKLGMVKFSSTAEIVSELQIISDLKSREVMMEKLPKDLFSATCIGCGLHLALEILRGKGNSEHGGIIVLVTDGKNSPGYLDISDVKEDLFEAGVHVITIAFGENADKNLENLADKTEGKSYFVKDEDSSEALKQAFLGASTFQSRVKHGDLIFKLFEKSLVVSESRTSLADVVEVDPTVGRNLKLDVFNLDNQESVESIELTGPDGSVFSNFEFDTSTATTTVKLAESGRWALNVNLKSTQSKPVLITVTTQLLPNVTTPITTRCWLSNGTDIKDANDHRIRIQASVWKGPHPVIGASVKAFVVKPNDEYQFLDLLDDGVNADTAKEDGVYSRYYIKPTQQGRYTFKCQVNGSHSSFEKLGFIGSANPKFLEPQVNLMGIEDEKIPMPTFTRIASGGSFKVEIPVSGNDSYPPCEVRDLSITVDNDTATNVSITLKWTAPGDDLDEGIVSYYELKYSDVVADVMNSNFDSIQSPLRKRRSFITEEDLVAGSFLPNEAGALQMATIRLTDVELEKPYYLSLRAVDKAEKASQVSNLVVFFIPNKSVVLTTRNNNDDNWGDSTEPEVNKEPSYNVSSLLVAAFGLILIAALAVILLLAIVKHTQGYRSYKGIPIQDFPVSMK